VDRERFDDLAVIVSTKRSRRAAVAALLGAALAGHATAPFAAERKRKGKVRTQAKTRAAVATCYPGTRCTPGRGTNNSRCDFSFSTLFRNRDVRGANLSNSTFRGADLRGADFRGANLSGGCFVGADLLGAKLGSSVNLGNTIFCDTRMPDGRIDDSGCSKHTACCPLLTRDCPDAFIDCFAADSIGICTAGVGSLGPVAHCWNSDKFSCCPCGKPEPGDWTGQCAQQFPGSDAYAVNDRQLLSCFVQCPFIPPA
jgi:hypothetical protein